MNHYLTFNITCISCYSWQHQRYDWIMQPSSRSLHIL